MYQLRTLGQLALERDGSSVSGWDKHRNGPAILAVLAAERAMTRDRIMALLWPDADSQRARGSLKQALHQLRLFLHDFDVVQGERSLSLDPALMTTDLGQFQAALASGDLEGAIAHYQGPFLDGVHLGGPATLEHWIDERRASLARQAADALERLARGAAERHDSAAAARFWERLAALEPSDSRVALQLIQAHEDSGNLAAAIRAAQLHQQRLQHELDLPPDPGVADRLARLRAAPAILSPAAASKASLAPMAPGTALPATTPAAHTRSSRALGVAVAVLTLVLGIGVVRTLRAPDPQGLTADLLAVAPFHAVDTSLALWREGIADMLIRDLDGAGPLRTVSGTVAFRGTDGTANQAAAEALGARTGAAIIVYGSVVRMDHDTLAVRASVLDRIQGRVADLEVRGTESRMGHLVDTLVVGVLDLLARTHPIASARGRSIGATSLPALREFLHGEQRYRRREYDSALAHYERAIAIEPEFALAIRRLSQVMGWGAGTGAGSRTATAGDLRRRAVALNHGLAPRDSLLLLADSFYFSLARSPDFESVLRNMGASRALLAEAAARYPHDPEIWYELSEAMYHLPTPFRGSARQILTATDRAIALDPGFGPAYEHTVELALQAGDQAAAAKYARAGMAANPAGAGSSLRLVVVALDSGPASPTFAGAIEAASANTLLRAGRDQLGWSTDSAEVATTILRHLARGRADERGAGPLITDPELRPRHWATALAFRGHLQAAAAMSLAEATPPRSRRAMGLVDPFLELALLGAIPDSVALREFARAFDETVTWAGFTEVTRYRHLVGAPWWFARRDTTALIRFAARAAAVSRSGEPAVEAPRGRYLHAAATAWLTLARGDSATARTLFAGISDSLCTVVLCFQEKMALARLQLAAGNAHDAARILEDWSWTGGPTPSAVLAALDHARVAEHLADTATARARYRFVAEAWRNADPDLQEHVELARQGAARMQE